MHGGQDTAQISQWPQPLPHHHHHAPSLAPPCTSLPTSFELTSEVRPEGGRRRASSMMASIMSDWFLVCYLHCSLGEKTSLPTGVLQFPLFIQDYTSNPIIKHRSCPESSLIACRCAQAPTAARPPRPPARSLTHAGSRIRTAHPLVKLSVGNHVQGRVRADGDGATPPSCAARDTGGACLTSGNTL